MLSKTKICILILCCMAFFTSCKNADKEKNSEENNTAFTKTPAHINIPGTKVYIIPPVGFKQLDGTLKGFYKDDEITSVTIMEFLGKNYFEEVKKNSPERMSQQGLSVFTEEEKKVGPYKGRLMRIGDPGNSTMWQLVFGDTSFSVMVTGIYSPEDDRSGKQVAEALETVLYDKEMKVDAQAGVNYFIKQNESGYQYLKTEAGMSYYSLDGKPDLKSGTTPYMVISQMAVENANPQSIAETALEALIRNGVTNSTIKSQGFLTINTSRAYEMEVEGTIKGKPVTIYIIVLAKNGIALMLQGKASIEIYKTITGFKNFADAIAIK